LTGIRKSSLACEDVTTTTLQVANVIGDYDDGDDDDNNNNNYL